MTNNPFDYFSDAVISKLHGYLVYPSDTFEDFARICRQCKWEHYKSCLSFNPIVPEHETCSYIGEPLLKDKQYLYEYYHLKGGYNMVDCIIYFDDAEGSVVGMAFYAY